MTQIFAVIKELRGKIKRSFRKNKTNPNNQTNNSNIKKKEKEVTWYFATLLQILDMK